MKRSQSIGTGCGDLDHLCECSIKSSYGAAAAVCEIATSIISILSKPSSILLL